jgi:NAD(P)-dependent dehydrogenase (short-subunit alcohol dehydrogenase family)
MGDLFGDRIVWITGASSGIGRQLALTFADQGADVAVSARRVDRLHEVVAEIEGRGRRGLAVACDVTDEDQLQSAVSEVVERLGALDVAVANAGFGVGGLIEELDAGAWRRQLEVNVVGLAMTARHALPHLRDRQGRLALVGSVSSMVPMPGSGAYSASKAAVRMIGQTLSMELHGSGVSCTTIHPGFVDSDIARVDNQGVYHPEREDRRPQKLMWPTDKAARVMVRAIAKRRREYVFTGHGKVGGFVGRHWPGLVHFALTRGG